VSQLPVSVTAPGSDVTSHTLAVTMSPVPCYGCSAPLAAAAYWFTVAVETRGDDTVGYVNLLDKRPHCAACLDKARAEDPDQSWFREPRWRSGCRCGRAIWTATLYASNNRAWCHRTCAARWHRRRVRGDLFSCATCRASFIPAQSDAAYCSAACRQRAYRRRQLERVP
jgi:hypothetical protein